MSSPDSRRHSRCAAAVLGVAGTSLTAEERAFFQDADPFGLILFARNIEAPEGVARLVADFRAAVGRADAPVFIDQEGGRVARFRPPHWPALPAAGLIGDLARRDRAKGVAAAALLGQAIAATIAPLGIDVACAPNLDVRGPGANEAVVGDRSFSDDPALVAALAAAEDAALRAAGIATTPKHAPGHGRANVDSHDALPTVDAVMADILADLTPYKAVTAAPIWMTAHIVFPALDPDRPATLSPTILDWLRRQTGYEGLIASDDLAMRALSDDPETNARAARAAGCDFVLYCPGDMAGNRAAVAGAGLADDRLAQRWRAWTDVRPTSPLVDATALAARLWAMLEETEGA